MKLSQDGWPPGPAKDKVFLCFFLHFHTKSTVLSILGGIDDSVAEVKEQSTAQGVTYLFALSRRELGFLTMKKVGVSIIGIFTYAGSEVCIWNWAR
jgi:fucose permease